MLDVPGYTLHSRRLSRGSRLTSFHQVLCLLRASGSLLEKGKSLANSTILG
jgi:hypothetical protein